MVGQLDKAKDQSIFSWGNEFFTNKDFPKKVKQVFPNTISQFSHFSRFFISQFFSFSLKLLAYLT